MNADRVIVDANIAFRCLVSSRGDLRERIGPGGHLQFFSPRFLFVELFKHKDRLARAANLPEADLLEALYSLMSRLELVNEAFPLSFTPPIAIFSPVSLGKRARLRYLFDSLN